MTTVKENAKHQVDYYRDCYAMGRKARKVLALLPLSIRDCNGSFDHNYGPIYLLTLHGMEAFDVAFDAGVVFSKNFTFTGKFNAYMDLDKCTDFMVTGKFPDGYLAQRYGIEEGVDIRVKVTEIPKPETCQVVAVKEEVTRYVSQCNETGEVL